MNISKDKQIALILIAITIAIFYVTRPVWHPFFMLFYVNPALTESLILALVCVILLSKFNIIPTATKNGTLFFILFFALIVVLLPLQQFYTPVYLSHHLNCDRVSVLPEIDPAVVRIVPKVVGDKYAMDALQFPRYTVSTGSIVFINKTPYWGYGLIPEGLVNSFILKDRGAIYVDMSAFGKRTKIVEKYFKVGVGMYITSNYLWQIYDRKYTVDCGNPYFVPYKNSLYIAVPLVGYDLHFSFPVFYTTPKWEGIALIASNGSITFLTPKQAEKCEVLKGQKLFPADLARMYVDSFNYIHGILNVLLYHKDQFEIADVPGQANEQPFLVATNQGLKWIIACEPYGQSYGIFRIYIVDARDGSIQLYQPSSTKALIGPVRAVDYVKQAMPRVDWQTMRAVEPIPVIVNGTLYWQVRVIPSDASGIAYVTMVNAENPNNVIILRTYTQVKNFLEGITVKSKHFEENVKYYIIIKRNEKIINKIPLTGNESIEIVPVSRQNSIQNSSQPV